MCVHGAGEAEPMPAYTASLCTCQTPACPGWAGTMCWGSLHNRICSPFHPGVGAQRSNIPVVHLEVNADC